MAENKWENMVITLLIGVVSLLITGFWGQPCRVYIFWGGVGVIISPTVRCKRWRNTRETPGGGKLSLTSKVGDPNVAGDVFFGGGWVVG